MFKIPDNVSKYDNVYDVLKERGFIEQTTDDEGIRDLLGREKVRFYIGFDATADCLHVGHFMQVIIMMYMQKYGHTPVVLIGGGTTMLGDPSGRTDARPMMTTEEIDENCRAFKKLFDQFLEFDEDWKHIQGEGVLGKGGMNKEPEPGKAICVNNADWLRNVNYLEFMRDVGKHFSVNDMLRAEAFKQRMEKGLSFLEFNYMLLQAYDFYVQARDFDCKIEFGGNDQWSNILAGRDLSRRLLGKDNYYGMTFALLTKADGTKMGKSQKGALWLRADRCSPYDFYQYWRNVDDADVNKCLRMLTFLPMEEVERLSNLPGEEINKAKETLAWEVTRLVHGEEEADKAQAAARALFAGGGDSANVPTKQFDAARFEGEGLGLATLMKEAGLASSNGEAMRAIEQGGVSVNGEKVTDKRMNVTASMFEDGALMIKKGKKTFMKITK
ncbi:MAG: tyrosine--tRNA ligase [Firmicutes bacterium]|jgi:tyrosyl-tRNA synthetase|nr:tyrosine--tRNA ligase [Bacillota bacterium]